MTIRSRDKTAEGVFLSLAFHSHGRTTIQDLERSTRIEYSSSREPYLYPDKILNVDSVPLCYCTLYST